MTRSEAKKKNWQDPEFRRRGCEATRLLWLDPEWRARVLAARKGKQTGENHPMFGKRHTAEARKKNSDSHKGMHVGENHPMSGRRHTEEARKRMSQSHTGVPLSLEHLQRRVASRAGYRHSEETRIKIGAGHKGKIVSEESKRKNSEAKKKAWQDPEYARKCLVFNSPNKSEMKLMGILDAMYPGEWKYVGDGQLLIAGKCPDFVNVNGQKKIIELYGERWHANNDPQDRINIFKPYGYDTLVVWAKELNGIKKLKARIEFFCGSM